jgi:pyruvate,water dikinase
MTATISSGIDELDQLIGGFFPGDNVVWQTDDLKEYSRFARGFAKRTIADGRECTYLRFAPHARILEPRQGLRVVEVEPGPGFDVFTNRVHGIIEEGGANSYYVFDNLSALVTEWATDELLANFYQIICPYVLQLGSISYFGLTRGQHDHSTVARIRDTTQILIDVYHVSGETYVHPVKVLGRYSPQMFLPHRVLRTGWTPLFQSGEAAAVSTEAWKRSGGATADSVAPWQSVYARLVEHRRAGEDEQHVPEIVSLKRELSRMLVGDIRSFVDLADRFFTVDDLIEVRNRIIGSGRIGGKATGMLLARRILLNENGKVDFSQVLEAHDSFYIGSDVFFTFLVDNDLFQERLRVTRDRQISREAFEYVEQRFLNGAFPPEIMEQFQDMLSYFGQAPIIVRSSSLLEDSHMTAFAGKYRSEFCGNQGSPEDRMQAFLRVLKLVYASALNPDAIAYRCRQGLMNSDEQMAILVQRVSGMPYKNGFFPSFAGVAFSKNLYAWTSRIDPQKGMIRLVFGLGTRAVNRLAGDYCRMISVSHPQLRPETGASIAKYSQRNADLIDLDRNEFATLPMSGLLADCDYPNLDLIASLMSEGYLTDIIGTCPPQSAGSLVATFDSLIRKTPFVKTMDEMLTKLEKAFGYPIDTEFTGHINSKGEVRICLLQCRSLAVPGVGGPVTLPEDIKREMVLFRSANFTSGGIVRDARYILYIDPLAYSRTASADRRKSLGRVVGLINNHPSIAEGKIIMMGPARWGSNNLELGVNVGFSDICNAAVLVEMAREDRGHVPEVSYGTHFFLDLVEAQIIYLPVYPSDPETQFNSEFFSNAPNVVAKLFPDLGSYTDIMRLIDVPASTGGLHAQVAADPHSRKAICFLQ